MQVTFKPTNYRFTFADQFFVERLMFGGGSEFVAAFSDLSMACEYAKLLMTKDRTRAVHVFSRDAQHASLHAPIQRAA